MPFKKIKEKESTQKGLYQHNNFNLKLNQQLSAC